MSETVDLLDELLSAASEELNTSLKNERSLGDNDLFKSEGNLPKLSGDGVPFKSVVRSGDTDSSDDESNRNYGCLKYNEYGKSVKDLLSTSQISGVNTKQKSPLWKKNTASPQSRQTFSEIKNQETQKTDVYSDPIFGIRIVNPLISSVVLQERMLGREAVFLSRISHHLQFKKQDTDWVIAGVIVNKSTVKTSQKGNQYSIWTLSDLKDDIKTVAVFLFSSAHNQLWKTIVGTVVGILNPNVLDKRDGSKDEASLSVDNSQKVMIIGQSKDFGTCRSLKKNGEKCTAIVNKNRCEFCLYHIKQEYQKCSKRSELQANFSGGGLTALRNKVLGKNEVFYAGKSYMAIPKKSKKLEMKDTNRLQSLNTKANGVNINLNNIVKSKINSLPNKKQNAARLDVPRAQRVRDIELLKKLGVADLETRNNFTGVHSSDITLEESKSTAICVINKLKAKNGENEMNRNEHPQKSLDNVSKMKTPTKSSSVPFDRPKISESPVAESQIPKSLKNVQLEGTQVENGFKNTRVDISFNEKVPMNGKKQVHGKSTPDTITPVNRMNPKSNNSSRKVDGFSDKDEAFQNSGEKMHAFPGIQSPIIAIQNDRLRTPNAIGLSFPKLSNPGSGNFIDLNKQITPRHKDRAKQNAIKLIQKIGPLRKADPNNLKGSGTKRRNEESLDINCPSKKSKIAQSEFISDRFKKMMAATSSHMDLLEARDDEEKEKYFNKLEAKERMEEKMSNTFKLACKAVRCLICKYTSFSASDLCKSEKHPLKVFDAMKRFFKCGNCGNRTVSLEIIPTVRCQNCGSGKWERTGMMKEKVVVSTHSLSIRGGEQKYTNSVVTDANINLLVPDTD